MKITYILYPILLLGMMFGFTRSTSYRVFLPLAQKNKPASVEPIPIIQEMIDQVNQERMLTDLRRLTGVEPICTQDGCTTLAERFTGSEDLQWAKDYVFETLLNLGYPVERLAWSSGSYSDENILAHKQGFLFPNEEIYFIAHLDGYPHNGPAADDDATGVVVLLELARILANHTFNRSVTLFFSTGEEESVLGAHRFVADYPERLASIKYLVSVEMLGYDSNNDGVMELWSGDENTEFQEMLSQIIAAYPISLIPQVVTSCT